MTKILFNKPKSTMQFFLGGGEKDDVKFSEDVPGGFIQELDGYNHDENTGVTHILLSSKSDAFKNIFSDDENALNIINLINHAPDTLTLISAVRSLDTSSIINIYNSLSDNSFKGTINAGDFIQRFSPVQIPIFESSPSVGFCFYVPNEGISGVADDLDIISLQIKSDAFKNKNIKQIDKFAYITNLMILSICFELDGSNQYNYYLNSITGYDSKNGIIRIDNSVLSDLLVFFQYNDMPI